MDSETYLTSVYEIKCELNVLLSHWRYHHSCLWENGKKKWVCYFPLLNKATFMQITEKKLIKYLSLITASFLCIFFFIYSSRQLKNIRWSQIEDDCHVLNHFTHQKSTLKLPYSAGTVLHPPVCSAGENVSAVWAM